MSDPLEVTFYGDLNEANAEVARLRAEVEQWKEHELEWFQVIESILNFHPVSQTEALNGGIDRVKRLKQRADDAEQILAQFIDTCDHAPPMKLMAMLAACCENARKTLGAKEPKP